jgi:serine/threonine protein kinase
MSKDKNENGNFDLDFEADDLFKINENYTILLNKKLGSGSFGQIYQCLNTKTNEILACKIESINELKPQLYHESKILLLMKNCTGFPTCYDFILTDQDKILIMDYLGPNLDTIMNKLPSDNNIKKFTTKTSLMIMIQAIERLKSLHEKGIIHRDIKPENFVIGPKNKERIIYLIDFGLSKKISNDKILPTIKADRNIIGTMRYISMNTHQGYEQGRRDDLESLFYIIIYFIKGELPWQNIKCKTRQEKYNKIFEIKKKVTEDGELVEDLPLEMKKILEYILGLNFAERPNYLMMKNAIELILNKLNYSNDLQFDWYNLDFLNYLYLTRNNMNEKEKIKENKKETKEETNKDKNIITNNIAMKLNTINNINGYNPKKLKFSYNKKIDNINNSYIRNKNNPVKQERSKSLMAIKRIYGQNITKKINNEYKKIKTYMEEKNDKGKLSNAVFNGKENVKIKNLRIKK